MNETVTGVAFLVASLYGAGQPAAIAQAVAAPQAEQATTTEANPLTDNSQIESYVETAYADEPLLIDIARCESNFRQYDADGNVLRGIVDNQDVGVMQINEKYQGPEAQKLGYDIYTAEGNVAYAKYIYAKYGANPWSSSEKCWAGSSELAQK